MVLVTEGGVVPEFGGDSDLVFGVDDELELVVTSLGDNQLQVCISERKGGGNIAFTETFPLSEGENRLGLGSFRRNPYVIRVAVNNTLVKNLTFSTK